MDLGLAIALGGIGVTGVFMGNLTSFVGLKVKAEFPIWATLFLIWAIVARVDTLGEFGWFVMISMAAGLATGLSQAIMFDMYRRNNPWYADKMPETRAEAFRSFPPFGSIVGLVWGVVFGGISYAIGTIF